MANTFVDIGFGAMTEITEFRKLSGALQKRIGHTNTLRWLTGGVA